MPSWLVKNIIISVLVVLANANGAVHRMRRATNCAITQEELQEMQSTINDLYEGQDVTADSGTECRNLISQTISCAVALKTHLIGKLEHADLEYNKTYEWLTSKETQFLNELNQAPFEIQDRNRAIIIQLTSKINELYQKIDDLQVRQHEHQTDLQYYDDYLGNGTKFATRFDDDQFFESAKKCEIERSSIIALMKQFDEITQLLVGNSHASDPDECFSELRHQISNFQNLYSHRTGEQRIQALTSTFVERAKCYQKLNDDLVLQLTQDNAMTLSQISDKFQELLAKFTTLTEKVKKLRREARKKAVESIVRMVRSGKKMRKAVDIFHKIRDEFPDSYQVVLKMIYNCTSENLYDTLRFTAFYHRDEGHEIAYRLMQACQQLNSPYILKINSVFNNDTLKKHVDAVYEGWTSKLQQGDFKQITEFLYMFDGTVIDLPRFFEFALNQSLSNMQHILKFIDALSPYLQKVVRKVFDDMKSRDKMDTPEFMELALWISAKMRWLNQQDSNSARVGDMEPYLKEIKNEMTDSLRTFAFEREMILAMENVKYLLRSETHSSVKFIAIRHPRGNFYKFQDLEYKKAFYSENCKDVKSDDERMRARFGTGNSDDYYWAVIPTDNTEFFFLKNKANGHFLSSLEDNVCLAKHWWHGCTQKELMNQAHRSNDHPSTKWQFTTRLFRDGLLKDRNQG